MAGEVDRQALQRARRLLRRELKDGPRPVRALEIAAAEQGMAQVPIACQLNLVGNARLQDGSTGLVRLSKNPGSSGVGPSATFKTGVASGCQ